MGDGGLSKAPASQRTKKMTILRMVNRFMNWDTGWPFCSEAGRRRSWFSAKFSQEPKAICSGLQTLRGLWSHNMA
jgi:hypothetical protein